jgi:hypothetical protein
MPDTLPVAPYKILSVDGVEAPWYIIPFDKDGTCTGPRTCADLIKRAREGHFTDIFLFSHGWNNDWKAATARYDDFITKYSALRRDKHLSYSQPHRPLLVGIFWPSTALVAPWEGAPNIAAIPMGTDDGVDQMQREIAELIPEIRAEERERFYELLQTHPLTDAQLLELARVLVGPWNKFQANAADLNHTSRPKTAKELVALWTNASADPDAAIHADVHDDVHDDVHPGDSDPNYMGGVAPDGTQMPGSPADAPSAAGAGFPNPLSIVRDIIRGLTVLQMKDRAALVGAKGVSPLLVDLLNASPKARIHMTGHSYGCVVSLSAICAPTVLPGQVESLLLLEPAVSRYCFATKVPNATCHGGYRPVLTRVRQPIMTTYSRQDIPLHKVFHLAVRRERDLGQAPMAAFTAFGDTPPPAPSIYAALGGYGPDGCEPGECRYLDLHPPGTPYPIDSAGAVRILALCGNTAITGHSDISIPGTWWALYQQIEAGTNIDLAI